MSITDLLARIEKGDIDFWQHVQGIQIQHRQLMASDFCIEQDERFQDTLQGCCQIAKPVETKTAQNILTCCYGISRPRDADGTSRRSTK